MDVVAQELSEDFQLIFTGGLEALKNGVIDVDYKGLLKLKRLSFQLSSHFRGIHQTVLHFLFLQS